MSSTVNVQIARLARILDPYCADTNQEIQDSTAGVTITGAANNGSGLIRITATNHNFTTGQRVYISGIVGTTEANNTLANPYWTVTYISASTFDLQGSAFVNVYTSGGSAVGAMVGSVGGAFSPQRLLDIYNTTRLASALVIEKTFPRHLKVLSVAGNTLKASLTFSAGVAAKPSGLIEVIRCEDSTGDQITLLPVDERQAVKDLESATIRFAFDYGVNWTATSGNLYIPDASTYVLYYRGITSFTLSQVLDGTTLETYADIFHPFLIEQAVKISKAQGMIDTQALTEALQAAIKPVG